MQGGQFNLSKRFIKNVPLPDFLSEQVPSDVVESLAEFGKAFSDGKSVNHGRLSALAARVYGVPLLDWQLEEQ